MTLNNLISRIRTIALAHKQIRRFTTGAASDFFADHTAKYPACCLQYTGAIVNVAVGGFMAVNFRMFVLDLVHVSEDSKINEDDVLSDTLTIILDLVTQMNSYNDWHFSSDSSMTAVTEYDGDLSAGWYIDFTIKIPFAQNICEIPTDLEIINPEEMADKLVYDVVYHATGNEGTTITTAGATPNVAEIHGKKILLITREQEPLYKVSSNPDSVEFTWDNNNIEFNAGRVISPNERFLIVYRNY